MSTRGRTTRRSAALIVVLAGLLLVALSSAGSRTGVRPSFVHVPAAVAAPTDSWVDVALPRPPVRLGGPVHASVGTIPALVLTLALPVVAVRRWAAPARRPPNSVSGPPPGPGPPVLAPPR